MDEIEAAVLEKLEVDYRLESLLKAFFQEFSDYQDSVVRNKIESFSAEWFEKFSIETQLKEVNLLLLDRSELQILGNSMLFRFSACPQYGDHRTISFNNGKIEDCLPFSPGGSGRAKKISARKQKRNFCF